MRLLLSILFLFFNQFIGAQLKVPHIDTCGRFGIACSIGGSPEESMVQTIYFVNNLKKEQLLNWLNSNDPQNQIHGYIGLYFMARNGLTLRQEEKDLMKKIERSDSLIDYCSGCIVPPKEKMSILLSKKRLANYYTWYSTFGWKNLFK